MKEWAAAGQRCFGTDVDQSEVFRNGRRPIIGVSERGSTNQEVFWNGRQSITPDWRVSGATCVYLFGKTSW